MEKITSKEGLKSAILSLEVKQLDEKRLLNEEFHATFDRLRPLNLIKNTIREATQSPEIKNNLLGAAAGLAGGILSKVIVVGTSHNPIKNIVGSLLQFGVSTIVARHPEKVKEVADKVVSFIKKKLQHEPEIVDAEVLDEPYATFI